MNIVICDDERKIIDRVTGYIMGMADKHGVDVTISGYLDRESLVFGICDSLESVDVILMDINLGGDNDGIGISCQLRDMGYKNEIIFLTVDKSRVFESFDAAPTNYILKEETKLEKCEEVFLNCWKRTKEKGEEKIFLSCAGQRVNIPLCDIYYFELSNRVITVNYSDGEFEFYSTMGKLENNLLDKGFIRVHRAYLVSTSKIKGFNESTLKMENDHEIPVGRTYIKRVREVILNGAV